MESPVMPLRSLLLVGSYLTSSVLASAHNVRRQTEDVTPLLSPSNSASGIEQPPIVTVCPSNGPVLTGGSVLTGSLPVSTISLGRRQDNSEPVLITTTVTAVLPNGDVTNFVSATMSAIEEGSMNPFPGATPLDESLLGSSEMSLADMARVELGTDGCQTIFGPSSTDECSTTIKPLGMPAVSVTACDQMVTFSTVRVGSLCVSDSSSAPVTSIPGATISATSSLRTRSRSTVNSSSSRTVAETLSSTEAGSIVTSETTSSTATDTSSPTQGEVSSSTQESSTALPSDVVSVTTSTTSSVTEPVSSIPAEVDLSSSTDGPSTVLETSEGIATSITDSEATDISISVSTRVRTRPGTSREGLVTRTGSGSSSDDATATSAPVIARGLTPRVDSYNHVLYYVARAQDLISSEIPPSVTIYDCPTGSQQSGCKTFVESWTLSTYESTTTGTSVAAYSGTAILTSGTRSYITSLVFSATITTTSTATIATILSTRVGEVSAGLTTTPASTAMIPTFTLTPNVTKSISAQISVNTGDLQSITSNLSIDGTTTTITSSITVTTTVFLSTQSQFSRT